MSITVELEVADRRLARLIEQRGPNAEQAQARDAPSERNISA